MKQMKKVWVLFMVMVVIISGCGQNGQEDASTGNDNSEQTDGGSSSDGGSEPSSEPVELTMLIDANSSPEGVKKVIQLAKDELNIEITTEIGPTGVEMDNFVKTRLASGEMADLCVYNSGALLAALNPEQYFIDISQEDFSKRLDDTYKDSVSIGEGVYGIPYSSTQAGAVLYSKKIYEELGLEIPKTWDEFIANCDAIKASGKTAIYGAYGDAWTTQLLYLADHYNVAAMDPTFAAEFEAGNTKYATNEAGLRSWEKLEATRPYYNEDSLAATYNDGCDVMASGEAGHWVMLTQALTNIHEIYGDMVNDIGVFPVPGDDPEDNGLTVWMPMSIYGNKNSEHVDAVKRFMEFYISDDALNAYASVILPDGPYAVKGFEVPDNAYDAVRIDMQQYFDSGNTESALEFQTPIKGPNCQPICQELIAGETTAIEAAEAYDDDCLKQAIQLGYDW